MVKKNNFSIVIPIFNESSNIKILYEEIILSIKDDYNYEVIFVDDCSTDNTKEILENLQYNNNLKVLKNSKNLGQSISILKGIKSAKYDTIITLDGDCQNNPKDIEKLLFFFLNDKGIKLVGGIRINRKDSYIKKISSKIANSIRAYILNDGCKDTGCSLKVFDKNIFLNFEYFDGIHRFLPALFIGFGYKTVFLNVDHRKRKYGKSKYGTFLRLLNGFRDMIKVKKMIDKNKNLKL